MKYLLSLFLLTLSVSAVAQNATFESIVADIQSNLMEVQAGDETYTHELELLNHSVLKYTLVEVDKKGRREELAYEFNIADLDPYVVREETKGDIIYLSLTVKNGQDFIKYYENGEVDGYEESLLMVTKNIDNARVLKELIKKAIPLAEEIMAAKLSVETYPEMEIWLVQNVVNAENSGDAYNQKMVALDDFPAHMRFIQTEISSKSSEEMQYIFNLADLNVNSLQFNISGSNFSLELETRRKQKLIQVFENGVPNGFVDEMEIFTNNVEEARDLRNILTKAIPLAEEEVNKSITKFDSQQPVFAYLSQFIQNIDYGDESVEQRISGSCQMTYTMIEADEKSSEKLTAEFNLMDINGNVIDFDVSSDRMFVELTTKESLDLIKIYENDELDGYDNELKIYADNAEIARRIKSALGEAISICERDYKDPFADMTLDQKITWLTENMGEVRIDDETITQKFERIDQSDPDKIKLTKLIVDSKGGSEEIFEFNFTDLNPKSIQYDIGSKELSVSFTTMFKEDIIKYYEDGEIEDYQDGFELTMADVEKARQVISVFNQIIAELSK
ncbi:MAG: hypothetical protein U5J95_10240 [Balneolaceae bacterium]|nr:hypothetical protein [Balneolaceae bacterium]